MTSIKKMKRQNIDAIRHINIAIRYAVEVKNDCNRSLSVRIEAKYVQDHLEKARWRAERMMEKITEEVG